jgi:quercetin dioxygenase-like cupin family protein
MSTKSKLFRDLLFVSAMIGGVSVATTATAGECPAGNVMTDATKPGATANSGATDTVLGMIDLSKEKTALPEHAFRVRKLVIQPGGEIAWHSHGDRPALIYVISGQIVEHASNCSTPIVHKAGEVARETGATSHWWKNASDKTVELLSADILHDTDDTSM